MHAHTLCCAVACRFWEPQSVGMRLGLAIAMSTVGQAAGSADARASEGPPRAAGGPGQVCRASVGVACACEVVRNQAGRTSAIAGRGGCCAPDDGTGGGGGASLVAVERVQVRWQRGCCASRAACVVGRGRQGPGHEAMPCSVCLQRACETVGCEEAADGAGAGCVGSGWLLRQYEAVADAFWCLLCEDVTACVTVSASVWVTWKF